MVKEKIAPNILTSLSSFFFLLPVSPLLFSVFCDWFPLPAALPSILRLPWFHLFPRASSTPASRTLPLPLHDALGETSPPAAFFGSFAQVCPLYSVTHALRSTAYSIRARNEIKEEKLGGMMKARQKYKSWRIGVEM